MHEAVGFICSILSFINLTFPDYVMHYGDFLPRLLNTMLNSDDAEFVAIMKFLRSFALREDGAYQLIQANVVRYLNEAR
jgi:hypothetical protein